MYIVAHNVNFYTGGGGFSSGATAGPFGQTFGKTTTTGFTTPAFGSAGSSLFGSSTPTTGGLFGGATATPVFGQAQTTQPSAFGTVLKLGSYVIPALCSAEEDFITFPVFIFFFTTQMVRKCSTSLQKCYYVIVKPQLYCIYCATEVCPF